MYREDDIVHENGKAWVLRDRPQKGYAVCVSGTTHSTVDSAYELNPDGLSIAIARCDYVANRIAQKQGVWSASIEATNIVATDEAFPACVCGRRLFLIATLADHTLEQCVRVECGKQYRVYEPESEPA